MKEMRWMYKELNRSSTKFSFFFLDVEFLHPGANSKIKKHSKNSEFFCCILLQMFVLHAHQTFVKVFYYSHQEHLLIGVERYFHFFSLTIYQGTWRWRYIPMFTSLEGSYSPLQRWRPQRFVDTTKAHFFLLEPSSQRWSSFTNDRPWGNLTTYL